MEKYKYTLEEIAASWRGDAKGIPIGKMMAWLIHELEELQHAVAECASSCRVPHDNDFDARQTLRRIADFYCDLQKTSQDQIDVYASDKIQSEGRTRVLRDALEAMPTEYDEWLKYKRWADSLRKQTLERTKDVN